MNLQLILAGPYEACNRTRDIWLQACQRFGYELKITDLESQDGKALENALKIKSFPALLIDLQVKAVGHPSEQTAMALIESLHKEN